MVERLFLTVPLGCLQFVIVVFPDHTHYFWENTLLSINIVIDDRLTSNVNKVNKYMNLVVILSMHF